MDRRAGIRGTHPASKTHDALDAGAVAPAAVEQDDLAARRQLGDISLAIGYTILQEWSTAAVLRGDRSQWIRLPPDA